MEDNASEPESISQSSKSSTRTRSDEDNCSLQEKDNNTNPVLELESSNGSDENHNSHVKTEGKVCPAIENIRCDFCERVFSRLHDKKRHIIRTNCAEKFQEKSGTCYFCKVQLKSKELKQHYIDAKCININSYNTTRKQDVFCEFCGRGFVSLYSKKNHLIKTACVDRFPNKVGVCHFCKKDFEGKELKQHYIDNDCKNTVRLGLNNNYVCDFCNTRFSNFDQKKKHIIATVCTDNYLELLGVCHFCKKQFKGNDLKEHYIQDNCVSVNSFTAWENQEYYCDFCGNGFKEFANKMNHIIKTNCTDKFPEKVGVCYYCKKEFKSKDLQQHYRDNICGEKRLKGLNKENVCDFCSKIFEEFKSKKRHIINTNCTVRFPGKVGVCYYCKKRFKSKDLRMHYILNNCERTSTSKVRNESSVSKSSREGFEHCQLCNKRFRKRCELKSHLKYSTCPFLNREKQVNCSKCSVALFGKEYKTHLLGNKCTIKIK